MKIAYRLAILLVVSCSILIWQGRSISAGSQDVNGLEQTLKNPILNKAILSEDWPTVDGLLEAVTPETPSVVLRLIKGHACLALNKNNQSVCLFLSCRSSWEMQEWSEWTKQFLAEHSSYPITHYLYGDSCARQMDWEAASAEFDKGLNIIPEHQLLLNALGVVYAQRAKQGGERMDQAGLNKAEQAFEKAAKSSKGRLADACANSGMLAIQMKDGAKGSLEAFQQGIDIAQTTGDYFSLAHHGKAWMRYLLNEKEANEAEAELKQAASESPCLAGLFMENMIRFAAYKMNREPEALVAELNSAGTTLNTHYTSYQSLAQAATSDFNMAQTLGKIPFVGSILAQTPSNAGYMALVQIQHSFGGDAVKDCIGSLYSKGLSQIVDDAYNRVNNWHATSGGAPAFNELAKGVGMGLMASEYGLVPGAMLTATGFNGSNMTLLINQTQKPIGEALSQYNKPLQPTFPQYPTSNSSPGGVQADTGKRIDSGKWPFIEYYGLAYGIKLVSTNGDETNANSKTK